MKLERLRGTCNDGKTCPTLYRTPDGALLIQGYVVTDPDTLAALNLPPGETAVMIPASLIPEVLPGVSD
jgi:hypothetical protein